jgi:hypothetical protein
MIVEGWTRRVEREVPMRMATILALAIAVICTVWLFAANAGAASEFEWYDFYPCFFGLADLILAIEVLPVRHGSVFPKVTLLPAVGIGVIIWFILSPLLHDNRIAAGPSLMAGAIVAAGVDIVHRAATGRNQGVSRFVRWDCGERLAFLPIWAVGVVGILGGLAMVCISQ